jgi:hypothetical protein
LLPSELQRSLSRRAARYDKSLNDHNETYRSEY